MKYKNKEYLIEGFRPPFSDYPSLAETICNAEAFKIMKYLSRKPFNDRVFALSEVLKVAVKIGMFNVVKFLVDECGVNPHLACNNNQNLLHVAASNETKDMTSIIEFLVKHGLDMELSDRTSCTPLEIATSHNISTMKALLSQGASIKTTYQWNPMEHCAFSACVADTRIALQSLEKISILLSYGANVNTFSETAWHALRRAGGSVAPMLKSYRLRR